MITTELSTPAPHIGDHVVLKGTRIVGDVTRIEGDTGDSRVMIKVTDVLGKPHESKAARAWRGAWVTCAPAMVAPLC